MDLIQQNMHRYDIKTFVETTIHLNSNISDAIKIQLLMNNIYALKKDALYISPVNY